MLDSNTQTPWTDNGRGTSKADSLRPPAETLVGVPIRLVTKPTQRTIEYTWRADLRPSALCDCLCDQPIGYQPAVQIGDRILRAACAFAALTEAMEWFVLGSDDEAEAADVIGECFAEALDEIDAEGRDGR